MKNVIYLLLITLVIWSCGNNNGKKENGRVANGNVYYGGIFKMNESENFKNLYPFAVTEVGSQRIDNQIYEGLVKLSQTDLTILPSLAEKWDKNDDATVWTFYIRKGVKFHDDPCFPGGKGREVNANDFKYCFTRLCESRGDNQWFGISFKGRVAGADEYYESTFKSKPLAEGVKGIKVIDDYTLQIELVAPFSGFLNILTTPACWVFPKEAVDQYKDDMRVKCVGTGPFRVKSIIEGESVILDRNPDYWAIDEHGNQLPYLDALKFSFVKEKKSEFLEFKRGNLDMIFRLPVEMIPEIVGDLEHAKDNNVNFEMQVVPALSVFYLGFQNQLPPFNKKAVRQAFNYSINRKKITNYTLQGEGIPAIYGFVPPSFKDYNNNSVKGYDFDPEKAKKLMAEAGYPNGKGFPKVILQTNSGGGDRNINVAEVVQKMLKENINVDVDINVLSFSELLENVEMGKTSFWRAGWLADYPDPETFLSVLYGGTVPNDPSQRSSPNSIRYKSPVFDSLFKSALREKDIKARYELYRKADQVAAEDAALMPIFYEEHYRLLQKNVRNFDANGMEYRDFSKVYFVPDGAVNDKKK